MGMAGEQISGINRTRPARPSGTRKESSGRMREREVRGEPTIRGVRPYLSRTHSFSSVTNPLTLFDLLAQII